MNRYRNMDFRQEEIKNAINVLQEGGIILYPTDTVWGIGCDATNEEAVKRIFDLKQRADHKAMIVLIDSSAKLRGYVDSIPEMAWELIELSTKPLTIIYPQGKNLAKNLMGSDGSIAIRITTDCFSKKLCETFRKPIVSTSANISGHKTPNIFGDIEPQLLTEVDYVVHYRQNEKEVKTASSIIKLDKNNVFKLIRQ